MSTHSGELEGLDGVDDRAPVVRRLDALAEDTGLLEFGPDRTVP